MSCNYQGYEFGAGAYPDSVCIDGRLFDADNCDDKGNLYEPGEDIPCPICCMDEAIEYWAEYNQNDDISEAQARENAKLLVVDIRRNRGIIEEATNASA